MSIDIRNCDCMELMAKYKDKWFDLAIIYPPYGIDVIGKRSMGDAKRKDGTIRHGIDKRNGSKINRRASTYKIKDWDKQSPSPEYFDELMRVSKNQIIFGANHFISKIPFDSPGWIVWDKMNGGNDFADCELAWTSYKMATRLFSFMWNGMLQGSKGNGKVMEGNVKKKEKRIHPTQKPEQLYAWILKKYAEKGMKILDTHVGSMSIVIAVLDANNIDEMELQLTASEIDKDYFDEGMKRIKSFESQLTIF